MTRTPSLSPRLRAFVRQSPLERRRIVRFVSEAARATGPGARVLDAGAGEAPYRELFLHCDYVTSDWANSPHPGARRADIIASLDALPVPDGSFDAVLCTEVLEHVANPSSVLRELYRVLAPGGRLWLTVPFVAALHEEPYDYYRYTPHGLRSLLEEAGFEEVVVDALGRYFTAMAALTWSCGASIGVTRARSDLGRRVLAAACRGLGRALPRLDRIDRRGAMTLGYACRAVRPQGA
jgi:SAM-dependent methyltransferase